MRSPGGLAKKKKVAVFDIDGTILRSSLLVELNEKLIEKGLFPVSAKEKYEKQYQLWQNRKASYYDYIDAAVASFMKHLKGIHYTDFAAIAEEVVEEQEQRVYTYTRDRIADLKKKGYFLLAISQSPKTILDFFCTRHGFHKVYGRVYELGPEDRFTGKIIDEHLIGNKANIVRRAVEKENLTLTGSVGIGDTEGDIPFLELVEEPVAFNPSALLHKHAKRMGWQVVVERKNVIYKL